MFTITIAPDQQVGLGMPMSGGASTNLSLGASATAVDATAVCGYRHGWTDVVADATVKGAFPGTSAWSPPI